jgi:hypothetical protein
VTLAPGAHEVVGRFDRDGKDGVLTVAVDGEDLASVRVDKIVRMLGSTGTDIGRDALSPVVDDYEGPFPWTGTIDKVVFEVRSRPSATDIAVKAATEMSRE